ncbi:MAG TPA: hypothetical protein VFC07_03680, partial [Verrucomicrobiae bacterium]|nr:hypothetical protein [Verrucomicrobiae bacterium]
MILSSVARTSSFMGKLILLLAVDMLIHASPACFGQTCDPLPSGLVGWWGGEGNAMDVMGQNNGTLFGNAAFANGEVGQAFLLDGQGSSITLNNTPSLQ